MPNWFSRPVPRPDAPVRLLCLPYAGGSHREYDPWASMLDPAVELWSALLPGRAQRFSETPFRTLTTLVDEVANQLSLSNDPRPLALFGHSMGGMVAYELARELARRGAPQVQHLFVSACAAPNVPRLHAWHRLSDALLLRKITDLNCVPADMLSHTELLNVMLPTLRADFQALETHRHVSGPALHCPIMVFSGTTDAIVDLALLPEWNQHSSRGSQLFTFDGDHFFIHRHAGTLIRQISGVLSTPKNLQEFAQQ